MPDRYSDPDDDDREERERRYDYAEAARRGDGDGAAGDGMGEQVIGDCGATEYDDTGAHWGDEPHTCALEINHDDDGHACLCGHEWLSGNAWLAMGWEKP